MSQHLFSYNFSHFQIRSYRANLATTHTLYNHKTQITFKSKSTYKTGFLFQEFLLFLTSKNVIHNTIYSYPYYKQLHHCVQTILVTNERSPSTHLPSPLVHSPDTSQIQTYLFYSKKLKLLLLFIPYLFSSIIEVSKHTTFLPLRFNSQTQSNIII